MRVISLTLAAGLSACGPSAPEAAPGASTAAYGSGRPKATPAPRARWAQWREAQSWPQAAPPFASRGHELGLYELTLRTNEVARDAYLQLAPGAQMPDGSAIVAFHENRETGSAGPAYVMEKHDGHWRYLNLRADGRPEAHGPSTLCRRCHAEAPTDSLFGLPASHRPRGPDGGFDGGAESADAGSG